MHGENIGKGVGSLIDDTVVRMQRFLAELVEFSGQTENDYGAPVIELQFGDVMTITSLLLDVPGPSLSITTLLPCQEEAGFFDMSYCWNFFSDTTLTMQSELLWHADKGHYVMLRQIPILDLLDERSVMDAILDASSDAANWLASVSGKTVAALIPET